MSIKNSRVLVTGGSGFIGSHLCRRLVQEGAELFVLVKYNSAVDNIRLIDVWDKITPIEADIRNSDSLAIINDIRPQIIYHLAAYNHVGDSFRQIMESVSNNSNGTANLLESYTGYERFIYISTSEVYGYQTTVPFIETATPFPLSPYAVGKYSGELFSRMKWYSANEPIVVLRPFNAFGPYQSPRAVIAETIIRCLQGEPLITTEGLQTREFNFVHNLVDGFILGGYIPDAIGKIINLGSGREIPINELIQTIHTMTNSKSDLRIGELPTRPGEIMRMCADNNLAHAVLGWSPQVEFEEGLNLTINWYKLYLKMYVDTKSPLIQLSSESRKRE